jgi:hypothetical protein
MNNRYIDRLRKLSWTINRWIQVYKVTARPDQIEQANRDFIFIADEISCIIDNTSRCYTRNQLVEFNKLYNQYKLSDEYSSPTAYANEY